MTWIRRYRLLHFFRFSFWPVPALGMILAIFLGMFTRWLDQRFTFPWFHYSLEGAQTLLNGIASSLLTFLVFVISSMLLVVQIASSQLTPRIIALAYSNRLSQGTLGLFVFTYAFTLATLARLDEKVPYLTITLAVFTTLVSIVVFFWFAQRLGISLRPVSILQRVGDEMRKVIDDVYPHPFNPQASHSVKWRDTVRGQSSRVVSWNGNSGVLMAFGAEEIVRLAAQGQAFIEFVHQVGDFIPKDDPLFRVYPAEAIVDERRLMKSVVIGAERTLEQDPTFGFRIMVDIAARALSPAINDPTTAVMALDQIHRFLRHVGMRQLSDGTARDVKKTLRLAYPTPNWEDFVTLAVSEIRLFGISSIQIPRRLRAMLEHLMEVLPSARHPALQEEMTLLQAAVQATYEEGHNRLRAQVGDRQGIGGTSTQAPA